MKKLPITMILTLAAAFTGGSPSALAQLTPLTLMHGWTNAPFGTSNAAVEIVNGIVHFKGAIAASPSDPQQPNAEPFMLPAGFTPATDVYIPVDLCDATNGRLHISPSGTVNIQAEGGVFSNAQCFTSLDGASFALTDSGFTPLTPINGWSNAPFSTSNLGVKDINGIFYFKGAINTSAGNPQQPNAETFVPPAGFAPLTDVYVPVDLCDATKGRLHFTPDFTVDVEAEGSFGNAQCFTSLDGAWFAVLQLPDLTLINGWTYTSFDNRPPAAGIDSGIVYLAGAIATSASNPQQPNAEPFVLPAGLRPATNVYVPVDLCNATKGRLFIQPTGDVIVQAENGAFANAQCFTSLDGVSFVQ